MANEGNLGRASDAPAILESLWRWWAERVAALTPEQLAAPTRCAGWAVRDLVAHATPDPEQLAAVLAAVLDPPPAVERAPAVLRAFNAPDGLAHTMAGAIAAAAVAAAPALPVDLAAARFRTSADLVAHASYDPDAVLPYPGVGSLTAAALTDVAVVDATVHGLDLVAAVGGAPPPQAARAHTLGVLVQVPELDDLIDLLTGRLDAASVLPVMR
jgi:uncharacterized protein (TIGR03083 family)